jgi:hypothetical protein
VRAVLQNTVQYARKFDSRSDGPAVSKRRSVKEGCKLHDGQPDQRALMTIGTRGRGRGAEVL